MTSNFTEIPILDLSLANDPSTRPRLLQELRHILLEVGFLYIKNHSVPETAINNLVNSLPRLFALPLEEKKSIALENSPRFLGYGAFGDERTAGNADQREQFEFATELEDSYVEGRDPLFRKLYGPNQWPSTYPEIQTIITTYMEELLKLSKDFLVLVAEALNLPSHSLLPFLSEQHRIKIAHYGPITDPTNLQGCGPHKDSSGWWTFLLQASPPSVKGLQALNRAGEWIDVPPIPNTFVVNIGQAFEVISGGLCPATTHRVLSSDRDRYSIPFFQGIRGDLTKKDFSALWEELREVHGGGVEESEVGKGVDSPFLKGRYDSWGESQLRTKIRSHPDIGRRFYGEVSERYLEEV